MIALLPRSLFGRVLLVLGTGLVLAQLASVLINFVDRGDAVYRLASNQTAMRIAQTVRVLGRLRPESRADTVEVLNGPDLHVMLRAHPVEIARRFVEFAGYERAFIRLLRSHIDARLPIRVTITTRDRSESRLAGTPGSESALSQWIGRHFYFLQPATYDLVAQVTLQNGTTAVFFARVPQEAVERLESLAPQLLFWLIVCFLIAAVLVGMVTRPLRALARAAETLGDDPEGAPLAESGPTEVRSVIQAFNQMQRRIRDHLEQRDRLLGALSHDLKTPITRMRLRTEMLADPALHDKFSRDLAEMESMVSSSLEFFRSLGKAPECSTIDAAALVESIAEDWREQGHVIDIERGAGTQCEAHPQALRRCVGNLIENAVRYGAEVAIRVEADAKQLRIRIADRGPGIPADDLERVFEPFVRLDESRNRYTGGTGLGLSIARNIARWHGGDVTLRNRDDGPGLVVELTLPR